MVTEALERVIEAGVKFKSVTFEHEVHLGYDKNLIASRRILEEQGLIRLFEDVRLWGVQVTNQVTQSFEDWWIDPKYFDSSLLNAASPNLFYPEVINVLKQNRNNPYTVQHHCCRAFEEEYDTFRNLTERWEVYQWIAHVKSYLNSPK